MYKYGKYSPKWKPSTDVSQEKLRSSKAHWNGRASEFVDDLINFKLLLNGRPNTFHSTESSLFKPLPADPATIIGVLSQDFEKIVAEANTVIDLQEGYSKTRKRKVKSNNNSYNLFSFGQTYQDLMAMKKSWNSKNKEFVKDFIGFIWLMNGKSNKFHMEKSFITEPIPADPKTIIGSLQLDFRELVKNANSIITLQSELKKKKNKKTSSLYELNMNKLATNKETMVTNGSSGASRFFTKLFTPTFGSGRSSKLRRHRFSLLDNLVPIYDEIPNLQKFLVQNDLESISEAYDIFKTLEKRWDIFSEMFKYVENIHSNVAPQVETLDQPEDSEKAKEKKKEKQERIEEKQEERIEQLEKKKQKLEQEEKSTKKEKLDSEKDITPEPTSELEESEESEELQVAKSDIAPSVIVDEKSSTIIDSLDIERIKNLDLLDKASEIVSIFLKKKSELSKKTEILGYVNKLQSLSLKWIMTNAKLENSRLDSELSEDAKFDLLKKKELIAKEIIENWEKITQELFAQANNYTVRQIEKIAQNYLSKWLGKTKHQLWTDETSALRLECYDLLEDIRERVNKIMDSLERGFSPSLISSLSEKINNDFTKIKKALSILDKLRTK